MKKAFLILVAFVLSLSFSSGIRAEEAVVWQGFEEGEVNWTPVDWENVGQVELSLSQDQVSEGEYCLKVDMLEEAIDWKNKVTFSREDYINLEGAKIKLDVYCPYAFGISVAVALDTSGDWTYYEAPSKPMKKGWNKDVTFDLSLKNFKTRESNWKHTEEVKNLDDVRKIHLMVYRPSKMEVQTVYIDNIRFE